ncbi:hypothetical protein BaRGS_00037822 [Batillaria attramentaria]|uniref:Uncharacterized protein n=1 Tax=Batillaria attramentaria TaxID=370345 RepID=A0ABD0J7K4_9CAEN
MYEICPNSVCRVWTGTGTGMRGVSEVQRLTLKDEVNCSRTLILNKRIRKKKSDVDGYSRSTYNVANDTMLVVNRGRVEHVSNSLSTQEPSAG